MRFLSLLAALLLAACSSQPSGPQTYLLRSQVATGSGVPIVDSGIALGTITVASYIDQPGLVLARGDGKVHAARNHVWAEPLQVSLRRYLATQLSSDSGRGIAASATMSTRVRVDVTVDQLHGDGSGSAILVAYWDVISGEARKTYSFSEQEALAGDGYAPLVKAEESLLQRLAGAIAASLPAAI